MLTRFPAKPTVIKILISLGVIASSLHLLFPLFLGTNRASLFRPDYLSLEDAARSYRVYTGHWPRNQEETEPFVGVAEGEPPVAKDDEDVLLRNDIRHLHLRTDFTPQEDGSCRIHYQSDYQGGFDIVHQIRLREPEKTDFARPR